MVFHRKTRNQKTHHRRPTTEVPFKLLQSFNSYIQLFIYYQMWPKMCPSSACIKSTKNNSDSSILNLQTRSTDNGWSLLAEFGALKAFASIFLGCFPRASLSNTVLNLDLCLSCHNVCSNMEQHCNIESHWYITLCWKDQLIVKIFISSCLQQRGGGRNSSHWTDLFCSIRNCVFPVFSRWSTHAIICFKCHHHVSLK